MPPLPSLVPRRREPAVYALVSAFESETQAVVLRTSPASEHTILYVLVGMIVLALGLISFTKLDRVVTGTGLVVPSEGTLYVQPMDKAIIREIRVKLGDTVKKGQVLATLDPTFAAADVAALQSQLNSLEAEIARCETELANEPFTYASGDPGNPPGAQQYAELQRTLYIRRKSQFDAQVQSFDQQIAQANATIAQLKNDEKRYGDRERLAAELETVRSQLVAKQLGSRADLLQTTDAKTEMLRNLESDQNGIIAMQHAIEATRSNRDAFIQQWYAQTNQELVTARNSYDSAKNQLDKAQKVRDLVNITAPADAIVLKIGKASIGSVVASGTADQGPDPLFTLVPLDSPLEVELHVDFRISVSSNAAIRCRSSSMPTPSSGMGRQRVRSRPSATAPLPSTTMARRARPISRCVSR